MTVLWMIGGALCAIGVIGVGVWAKKARDEDVVNKYKSDFKDNYNGR